MNNSDKSNNIFTFEIVAEMLSNYQDMKRKASQLEFELTALKNLISDSEYIDAMSLASPQGDGVQGGFASDKTANIAISYSSKLNSITTKDEYEMQNELFALTLQMERIKHYIRLLPSKHFAILHKLYVEGFTFNEIAESESLSVSAIKKYRKQGIKALVDMFNFVTKRN